MDKGKGKWLEVHVCGGKWDRVGDGGKGGGGGGSLNQSRSSHVGRASAFEKWTEVEMNC